VSPKSQFQEVGVWLDVSVKTTSRGGGPEVVEGEKSALGAFGRGGPFRVTSPDPSARDPGSALAAAT
jgi:hypothetical protein